MKSKVLNLLRRLFSGNALTPILLGEIKNCKIEPNVRLYKPYKLNKVSIGKYTYISCDSKISYTNIGKFCSIGPNVMCGWGIHPTNSISTSPYYYSDSKQNGSSLSHDNKIEERKIINIGNDVFIGMNSIILDGITIGDGAIIGAGAVVSKNIPPYSIAVGNPISIIRYRFDESTINKLLEIKWWDHEDLYVDVEHYFFNVEQFIKEYSSRY